MKFLGKCVVIMNKNFRFRSVVYDDNKSELYTFSNGIGGTLNYYFGGRLFKESTIEVIDESHIGSLIGTKEVACLVDGNAKCTMHPKTMHTPDMKRWNQLNHHVEPVFWKNYRGVRWDRTMMIMTFMGGIAFLPLLRALMSIFGRIIVI